MSALTDELDAVPLLAALSAGQRAALAGISRIEEYAEGTRLFDEGGPADRCWVLLSGCVAVDTPGPERDRVVIQSVGPHELLGWSWLVPPHRWHFGATVVRPTRAVVMDTDRLRVLAQEDTALGYRLSTALLDALLNRLQGTRIRLLDLYRSRP